MTFDDDEQIYGIQTGAAGFENEITVGSTKVKIINVPNAQPKERILKMLVEVTGKRKPEGRFGLDLVIVLDISQHMNKQDRLEKVKKATEFVIKKLSPVDRVSIVTFAEVANKLCALRQINKGSQKDILDLVNGVACADGANMSSGLEMALQVLSGRKLTEDRSVGIIIMSSGEQDGGRNATEIKVGKVPVYTLGFGIGSKDNLTPTHVLDAIAKNSAGGTYADVQNGDDLSVAFAQCFAGLMKVAVQDLKLVMSTENMSTLENVYAGDHEKTRDASTVSVMLGNVYDKETRKVLVHVLLPDTNIVGRQVLNVAYKYRNELGKERKSPPLYASKKQIQNFTQEEKQDMRDEVIHLESAHMLNEGRSLAYINSPIGEGNVKPSSEVSTKGDVGSQKQDIITPSSPNPEDLKEDIITPSSPNPEDLKEDITTPSSPNTEDLKEDIIAPSSKVAARGYMQKLILLFTKLLVLLNLRNDMHQNQGELFEEDILYQLPRNADVKKEITSPSSELTASADGETTPLFPPSFTDNDNTKEEIITPFSKVATRGFMDIVFLFFTKLFLIFNLRNDTHKKKGELFERDYKNPSTTNKENVEGQTTPAPTKSTASGDVKKPPLLSVPCADENGLKEENITLSSKVPAGGFMEKLVLLFTKLLMFFDLHNHTHPEGESLEKDHTSSFPRNEENAKGEDTQPSSNVATSGAARQKQAESSDKNHPNLLPTNEDNSKDIIITPPFQGSARSYMEKLVLLFTKLLMFFNLRNCTHKDGESLRMDHTSVLPTNKENVNDENPQLSSKVATIGDAHKKKAESSDKNHPNLLPADDDKLKDGTIATSSKVATGGYMEKLLLFFTSHMNRNQRQTESIQTNDTNSLSTDEHNEKERQYFISIVTRKIMESLTGISKSVATQYTKISMSIQALVATSFAYYYSPILLVQDALRSPPSAFKTIMKVPLLSVAAATVLYMVYVCFSYAKLRTLALANILYGFGLYNPFWLLDITIISIVVLLVGAYQVYYQPLFDFVDKHAARNFPNNEFLNKEIDISLPSGFNSFKLNLFRLVWRTIFVIITTIILMRLSFFKVVVAIFGAFGFWPLTVYFLVEMYVVQKNVPEWSSRWISLHISSVACLIIATAAAAGTFAEVVTNLKVYRQF